MRKTTAATTGGLAVLILFIWNDCAPYWAGHEGAVYPVMGLDAAGGLLAFIGGLAARFADKFDD